MVSACFPNEKLAPCNKCQYIVNISLVLMLFINKKFFIYVVHPKLIATASFVCSKSHQLKVQISLQHYRIAVVVTSGFAVDVPRKSETCEEAH